jgi:hypothetical protein
MHTLSPLDGAQSVSKGLKVTAEREPVRKGAGRKLAATARVVHGGRGLDGTLAGW